MTDMLVSTGTPTMSTLTNEAPESDAFEVAFVIARGSVSRSLTTSGQVSDSGAEMVEGLPRSLVSLYAKRAAWHARVREVDPGVWVATVAGLDGVYGDGESAQAALDDLVEAVVGWVVVRRRHRLAVPPIDGLDLNVSSAPGTA